MKWNFNLIQRNVYFNPINLKYSGFPILWKNFYFLSIIKERRLKNKSMFIYINPLDNLDKIRKDTKGFSGIYLWYNKINGKIYIGSGTDLYRRIKNYFQPVYQKRSYPIFNAINKYGLNSFILIILEIIGKSSLVNRNLRLMREDYYLSSYLPEYNILQKGSSSLNYKHSLETRAKIKTKALMRDKSTIVYSKEFLLKQKGNKYGVNNPMFGKTWNEERRKKFTKPVYVYDSKTNNLISYYSETVKATKELKIGYHTLRKYIELKKPFKGKLFSRTPIIKTD